MIWQGWKKSLILSRTGHNYPFLFIIPNSGKHPKGYAMVKNQWEKSVPSFWQLRLYQNVLSCACPGVSVYCFLSNVWGSHQINFSHRSPCSSANPAGVQLCFLWMVKQTQVLRNGSYWYNQGDSKPCQMWCWDSFPQSLVKARIIRLISRDRSTSSNKAWWVLSSGKATGLCQETGRWAEQTFSYTLYSNVIFLQILFTAFWPLGKTHCWRTDLSSDQMELQNTWLTNWHCSCRALLASLCFSWYHRKYHPLLPVLRRVYPECWNCMPIINTWKTSSLCSFTLLQPPRYCHEQLDM